jgi:hypothetical protein
MSKKHFVALAVVVRDLKATHEVRRSLALALADLCSAACPRFNRSRFLNACGVEQ